MRDTTQSTPLPNELWLLTAGIFTIGMQALMIGPMIPDIGNDLGVSPAALGRAASLYGISIAITSLLAATLLDRLPRRRFAAFSLVILAGGMVLCAVSQNLWTLALGQVLAGCGAGIALPALYALASDLTPPDQRIRAVGRVILGWSISLIVGVPMATLVVEVFGWQEMFAIAALSCISVALLLAFKLPKSPKVNTDPTSYRAALAVPSVALYLLLTLLFMGAFYGTYLYIADHARAILGQGPALGGIIALTYGIGFGLATMLDGELSRFDPGRVMPVLFGVIGCIYFVLPLAVVNEYALVAVSFLWGAGNHFGLSLLVSKLSAVSDNLRGAILALYSSISYLALFLASILFGQLYQNIGFFVVGGLAAALIWAGAIILFINRNNPKSGAQ